MLQLGAFFSFLFLSPFDFFKLPFGCLVPSFKKKINKPKHYSSKFNIAHLPGKGLRECEKHPVKMVLS